MEERKSLSGASLDHAMAGDCDDHQQCQKWFEQYPDLEQLRKYWSLCIVVPEGQYFNPHFLQSSQPIPKFLYNSSLFSKVLFLLFVNNYETIP
jgi:hypothetical protein